MRVIEKGSMEELTRVGRIEICDQCLRQYQLGKRETDKFLIIGTRMLFFCSEDCYKKSGRLRKKVIAKEGL